MMSMVLLEVAKNDPLRAMEIKRGCSMSDVAIAYANIMRTREGVGYTVE